MIFVIPFVLLSVLLLGLKFTFYLSVFCMVAHIVLEHHGFLD